MVDFEKVFKNRSKQTVICIGELSHDGFVCGDTSRTSLSAMRVITRGCFDILNARLARVVAEVSAADHRLVAQLTSDGLVRQSKSEDARAGARMPAPFAAHEAMDLEVADEQYTPCEIVGGRPLITERRILARRRGPSPVGRTGRRRHHPHRFRPSIRYEVRPPIPSCNCSALIEEPVRSR
jgi:hypothetical protein